MKKLLLLLFLLIAPIKAEASGYMITEAFITGGYERCILVIDEDENGKEIRRWWLWIDIPKRYWISYEVYGEEELRYRQLSHAEWTQCKENGYYCGE